MICYYNNSFLEKNEIKVSPFDRGFLFGDGIYEAIRTYNSNLFMYEEHLARLKRNLIKININYEKIDALEGIIYELIERNNFSDNEVNVYLQITRGESFPRKHEFPAPSVSPTIFVYALPIDTKKLQNDEGISIILKKDLRWKRCDIKTINLLPAVMAKQEAVLQQAYEAVWHNGNAILEGSHTNFFGVRESRVYTHPLDNSVLPGITREIIKKLCKNLNIPFVEQPVLVAETNLYEEFFITGTTTEIKPVIKIEGEILGGGKPGKISTNLIEAFTELTKNYYGN
jgi:D-alanine transaminase